MVFNMISVHSSLYNEGMPLSGQYLSAYERRDMVVITA